MRIIAAIAVLGLCGASAAQAATLADASPREQAEALVPLLWKCMHVPERAVDASAVAKLELQIIDGHLVGEPKILMQPRTAMEAAMLKAAIIAVKTCNPYPSGITVTVDVTFDPRDLY
jgi:hypothetical protein